MSEDRPLDDVAAALKRLDEKIDDGLSTLLARLSRRPTGTVELTLRATPPPGTVFMLGQTVPRATYADLWAWATENNLVGVFFGPGDGSTTFLIANMAGRAPVGCGTLDGTTYAPGDNAGSASITLTTAQMPSHSHPLTGGTGTANNAGDHGGHFDASLVNVPFGPDYGVAPWNSPGSTRGAHTHTVNTSVFSTAVGGGAAFDNRPPFAAFNYAIWL